MGSKLKVMIMMMMMTEHHSLSSIKLFYVRKMINMPIH